MKKIILLGVLVISCMILFSSSLFAQSKTVKIDGSSTVYPITEAVAEEFQNANRGKINVTVGISGTGGGFKKFCRGETDIANASRPISAKEIEACKNNKIDFIELPVAYDGIVVVVNPANGWVTSLTIAELKKIWEPQAQGKILKWNQINSHWPDNPLKLYGAGADSGTFDYFTEEVVGKAKSSRGDYTASEDDNILVQGVTGDKFALGYFGFSYYKENENKLKALAINNGKNIVIPSEKSIENGTYSPLSRPLFVYINKNSAEKSEVKSFVEFLLKNAPTLVKEAKCVPLSPNAYNTAQKRFAQLKTGTIFKVNTAVK